MRLRHRLGFELPRYPAFTPAEILTGVGDHAIQNRGLFVSQRPTMLLRLMGNPFRAVIPSRGDGDKPLEVEACPLKHVCWPIGAKRRFFLPSSLRSSFAKSATSLSAAAGRAAGRGNFNLIILGILAG